MNRQEKRKLGLCYDCDKPADALRTRCTKHRKSSVAISERYQKTEKGKKTAVRLKDWLINWRKNYRRAKGRFQYVKKHALRKNKEWKLSESEYYVLISQPCFYCNLKNDVQAGIGLDRLNNKKGYIRGNIVSCCSICNYVRGDRFSPEEMKLIGLVIQKIRIKNNK